MVDVRPDGSLTLRFIDLGLSRVMDGSSASMSAAGTPQTMAPEVREQERASVRSEVFSLGVSLAWALTGEHPFGAGRDWDDRVRRIRDYGPDLAGVEPPYAGVLRKCLEFDPAKRYQTPAEVVTALTKLPA
jgi:serine/threonine protein kinase